MINNHFDVRYVDPNSYRDRRSDLMGMPPLGGGYGASVPNAGPIGAPPFGGPSGPFVAGRGAGPPGPVPGAGGPHFFSSRGADPSRSTGRGFNPGRGGGGSGGGGGSSFSERGGRVSNGGRAGRRGASEGGRGGGRGHAGGRGGAGGGSSSRGFEPGRGGGRGRELGQGSGRGFGGARGGVIRASDKARSSSRGHADGRRGKGELDAVALPREDFNNLIPFEKNFYFESPSVQMMSEKEVIQYRQLRDITVEGHDIPKPIRFFHEASFPGIFLSHWHFSEMISSDLLT